MAGPFFGGQFFGGGFFQNLPVAGGTIITFLAGKGIDRAEVERIRLELELKRKKRALRKLSRRVKAVEAKATVSEPPAGILANLHLLEMKQDALQVELATIVIDLAGVKDLIGSLTAESFDDDDEDFMDFMNEVKW